MFNNSKKKQHVLLWLLLDREASEKKRNGNIGDRVSEESANSCPDSLQQCVNVTKQFVDCTLVCSTHTHTAPQGCRGYGLEAVRTSRPLVD